MNFSDNPIKTDKSASFIEEIDSMVEPLDPDKPESVLFHFFLFVLKGECDKAWKMFTRYSQHKIIDGCYDEMKETDDFYLQNEITSKKDLRRAFEENHLGIKEAFWLNFAINCSADYMVELGEFKTKTNDDKKAIVEVILQKTDSSKVRLPFNLVYEDDCWRVGMIESMDN